MFGNPESLSCEQNCPFIAWIDGRLAELETKRSGLLSSVEEHMRTWEELESGDVIRDTSREFHGVEADEDFVSEVLRSQRPFIDDTKQYYGVGVEGYLSHLEKRTREYEERKRTAIENCPGPLTRRRLLGIGGLSISCGNLKASAPYKVFYET